MKKYYKRLTPNPFCSLTPSIDTIAKLTLAVLTPHILMLFFTESFRSLLLLACVLCAAHLSRFCYAFIKKSKMFFSWPTVLQGMLIGMFLPDSYPPAAAFFTAFAVLLFNDMIFDGFAQSWANTVVFTLMILYFMHPDLFPPFLLAHDYFSHQNAGSRLFSANILQPLRFDSAITAFFNKTVFNDHGGNMPEGYITLLWDFRCGIPAFRFNIFTLLASLVLIARKAADALMPFIFLSVYAIAVRLFGLYPYGDIIGGGDILLALCTGGTLFAAFFMLGWFGTTPMTLAGKCIYAGLGGVIMFCMCGCGTASAGVLFTLMFLNIISPLIQYAEDVLYSFKLHKILVHAGIKGADSE